MPNKVPVLPAIVALMLIAPLGLGYTMDGRRDLSLNATDGLVALGFDPAPANETPVPGIARQPNLTTPDLPPQGGLLPPPGLGMNDPWLDARGDTLFGPLNVGGNALQFAQGPLDTAIAGQGLRFNGQRVCTAALAGIMGCGGDISAVNAGFGLTGGGDIGDLTLAVNDLIIQRRVGGLCSPDSSIRIVDQLGAVTCETDDDTTYGAGTGLSLADTTFNVNTGVIQNRVVGTCDDGSAIRVVNADGTVSCEPDTDTTYTAGDGLSLSGTSFSLLSCADGKIVKHSGGVWACGDDADTTYSAGTGLSLSGTTLNADTGYLQRRVTGTCPAGESMRIVASDGTVTCEVDTDTTYSAGEGLVLEGTRFGVDMGRIQDRVTGTCAAGSSIRVVNEDGTVACEVDDDTTYDGGDFALSDQSCAAGDHVSGIDAAGLVSCADDMDTTYTAGTGLSLASTTFSADTAYLQRRVSSSCPAGESISVIASDGTVTCEVDTDTDTDTLGDLACATDEIAKWDGTVWTCANDLDTDTTYSAGQGLALAGTTFSVKDCAASELLKRNAGDTDWVCSTDADTTYDGGDFALSDQACAAGYHVSGIDATGAVSCAQDMDTTYTASQGLALSGTDLQLADCAADEVWKRNPGDTAWACAADNGDAPVAGDGISVSGNTVSVMDCAAVQVLKRNAGDTAWGCGTDADTTYSGSEPIVVNGTTIELSIVDCEAGDVWKWSGNAWSCREDEDTGTVTSVGSGFGLLGGPITGTGTLNVDDTTIQARIADSCAEGKYVRVVNQDGTVTCGADANSGGTVTSVASGPGLTGGPITGSGTLSIATGGVTSAMILDAAIVGADIGAGAAIAYSKLSLANSIASGDIVDGTVVAADVDPTSIQRRVTGFCVLGQSIRVINQDGTAFCEVDDNSGGTVTQVSTGAGLTGGPITSTGTLSLEATTCLYGNVLTGADANGLVCTAEHSWSVRTVPRANAISTVDDPADDVGSYTSLTVGADGLPVISYYDSTAGALKVAKCANIKCTLTTSATVDDPANDVGSHTSIAIGTDGFPVIAYRDETEAALKVAKCGNPACSAGNTITFINNPANAVGEYTSIAIGTDGLPVISYHDGTAGALKVAKCGNAACSAGNTVTTVDDPANFVGRYTSIAIGTDGFPVISYHNNTAGTLMVAKCGNAACSAGNTLTAVDDPPTNNVGGYSSIAIGTDGFPVISYRDGTATALKVAKCGDADCTPGNAIITTVDDPANFVGLHTSIAIGTDGFPVISYRDVTAAALKVAKCGNAACSGGSTITTVDDPPTNNVGGYSSIAIGTDGLLVISYHDLTAGTLKVAHLANEFGINNWWRRG